MSTTTRERRDLGDLPASSAQAVEGGRCVTRGSTGMRDRVVSVGAVICGVLAPCGCSPCTASARRGAPRTASARWSGDPTATAGPARQRETGAGELVGADHFQVEPVGAGVHTAVAGQLEGLEIERSPCAGLTHLVDSGRGEVHPVAARGTGVAGGDDGAAQLAVGPWWPGDEDAAPPLDGEHQVVRLAGGHPSPDDVGWERSQMLGVIAPGRGWDHSGAVHGLTSHVVSEGASDARVRGRRPVRGDLG